MLKIPKNSVKNLNFWIIFGSFSIAPSYALWDTPQFLSQIKDVMEMHNHGKFHIYSICGCKVIKFQMFLWRWSMKWPILGFFLGPNSPKYGLILLKFLPEVVLKETKTVLEERLKNSNFSRNGRYPKFAHLVQLWAQFTPWRWLKSGKIKKLWTKIQPSGYPNLPTQTP